MRSWVSPDTFLILSLAQCLLAHQVAWQKAGVLHRDISIGNIMIDNLTGRGFLSDWDLARYAEDLLGSASEPAGISVSLCLVCTL